MPLSELCSLKLQQLNQEKVHDAGGDADAKIGRMQRGEAKDTPQSGNVKTRRQESKRARRHPSISRVG